MQVIDHQFVLDLVGEVDRQATAQAIAIDIAGPVVLKQISLIAVALLIETRHPSHDLVAHDGGVDRAFNLAQIVIAQAAADVATKCVGRANRGKQHSTAG